MPHEKHAMIKITILQNGTNPYIPSWRIAERGCAAMN